MSTTSYRLNLGCGTDIRDGWINLDMAPLPGIDVVHDLNIPPLPFADNQFTELLCNDVLEHVDLVPLLKECHRILAPGGRMQIEVPHGTSNNCYVEPTHQNRFSVKTFRFSARSTFEHQRRAFYYFDFAFSANDDVRLRLLHGFPFWRDWLVPPLVNHSHSM